MSAASISAASRQKARAHYGKADGHGMAVRNAVAAECLDGVPGRVAEVQQLPRTAVEFVGAHGVPFAGDAAGQDRHAVKVRAARGQMGKQVRVEQHGRFQRLGAAVAQHIGGSVSSSCWSHTTAAG